MFRKLNRMKAKNPGSGVYWCSKCDANLVGSGSKCSVCGFRFKGRSKKADAFFEAIESVVN